MAGTPVSDFLRNAGDKPYRKFVKHHIRRQSTEQLRDAAAGETLMLPADFQPYVEVFLDAVNGRLGYDKGFWRSATCREAFDLIMDVAMQAFPIAERIRIPTDVTLPENEELLFRLFQIATLNFAYSGSYQPGQRKFMGIRKGIFR